MLGGRTECRRHSPVPAVADCPPACPVPGPAAYVCVRASCGMSACVGVEWTAWMCESRHGIARSNGLARW